MAGRPERPGWSHLALLTLCALATLAAACADAPRPASAGLHTDAVQAAILVLERQMDESLEAGPPRSLTELDGLRAAMALGAEGTEAARLWDAEIRRHYRGRRWTMQLALESEVRRYEPARIEVILGRRRSLLPDAPGGAPDEQWRTAVSFFNTQAYRRGKTAALCSAMDSTPSAWRARYPDRAPFTFERFGIDAARIATWCESRDLP